MFVISKGVMAWVAYVMDGLLRNAMLELFHFACLYL